MTEKLESHNLPPFGYISLYKNEGKNIKERGIFVAYSTGLRRYLGEHSNSLEDLKENIFLELRGHINRKKDRLFNELSYFQCLSREFDSVAKKENNLWLGTVHLKGCGNILKSTKN